MLASLTYRREDGTFVGVVGGYPYHIIQSDALFPEAEAMAAEMGDALPFEPPPAPPAPQPVTDVSFWQFMMAAASLQIITWAEAEAAVATRAIPALFAATLDALPEPQRTMARIKYMGVTRVLRGDDLFGLMVATGAATNEQIDGVFAVAATIT